MATSEKTAVLDSDPAARRKKGGGRGHPVLRLFLRFLAVLLVTALLLLFAVYGVMYVLAKGPSPTARRLFVMSVRETSAVYFLADWFFTPEEIARIESAGGDAGEAAGETADTDASLIQIGAGRGEAPGGEAADAYGLVDDDGDGIIVENVSGPGYLGYMMVVLDPSRLCFGTPPAFGEDGETLERMAVENGCVAGINGGGFDDPGGVGTGGIPIGMTIVDGEISYAVEGVSYSFVGFDGDHILHTGQMTPAQAREKDIRFGCTFGPVLVANGEPTSIGALLSGVNPRTAIGQRADGAILLLVIDGRQARSLGATLEDLSSIMLRYGAMNACNLDGGSSSSMWFDGKYINSTASVIGDRRIPTAFLVKREAQK